MLFKKRESAILIFSTSYTAQQVLSRKLEVYYESRDASNFFKKIIVINPVAQIQNSLDGYNYNYPKKSDLNEKIIFLEGGIASKLNTKINKLEFILHQLRLLILIVPLLFKFKIYLIRGEDPRIAGIYASIFSSMFQKPLIIGVWGNPNRIRKDIGKPISARFFKDIKSESDFEKKILKKADAILVQNSENKRNILEIGIDVHKIFYSKLGVGINKNHYTEPKSRSQLQVNEFVALKNNGTHLVTCLSRIEKVKFVADLIEVAEILKAKKIDFKLIIIGDGSERDSISEKIFLRGLSSNVVILGNQDQEWLAEFLVLVDVALAPLLGRALLEIGLAGCPVVAYDIDWHSEIVKNGETGYLVPANDTLKMAELCEALISNKSLRMEMSKKMREVALSFANPEEQINNQRILYKNLIGYP